MQHTRTWTDIYGSACASFDGRAGGHIWVVSTPPKLAAALPSFIEEVDGKGSIQLLVHESAPPLLAFLKQLHPRGVVVVAEKALASGPAIEIAAQDFLTEDGLSYQGGGHFPAWQSALGTQGPTGENIAASATASLGFPVQVTTPEQLQETLEHWLSITPHGR